MHVRPAGSCESCGDLERTERDRAKVERERDRLRRENERLKQALDLARRAAKRQAAPFSKGAPTPAPRRAGRRAVATMAGIGIAAACACQ